MTEIPEKIKLLNVEINNEHKGQLLKQSQYEFRYLEENKQQACVSLLMPPQQLTYCDSDLFPVMDQNLPEGDLFYRLRQMFPKQPLTPMHLLALSGKNSIGRLGFIIPEGAARFPVSVIDKETLIHTRYTPDIFNQLVQAYIATGNGIAGIQPKIMVPTRLTVPIPDVIVKTASDAYPGLAANEYLCMSAARRAKIIVPGFELSDDGQILLIDRFDIAEDGSRLGFEDIAALMGLRVRDTLSDRKYQGSYQRIVELLHIIGLSHHDIERFFEQIAFSIMVRNGDGHLKNYGVLYINQSDVHLSPLFDVVTTAVYRYQRYDGGPELEDKTMALKLFAGKNQTKTYPVKEELMRFGRDICGVKYPEQIVDRIAQSMQETMQIAKSDDRIPKTLLQQMSQKWDEGIRSVQ